MSRQHTKHVRANREATETELDVSYLRGLRNDLSIKALSLEHIRPLPTNNAARARSLRRTIQAIDRAITALLVQEPK